MVIFHSYVKLPEGNHHAKPLGVLGETVFSDDKPIYLRSTFIFEIRWWFGNAFSNETSIDWLQGQSTYRNHGLYGQVLIFSAPFFIQQAILGGRYLKLCLYGLNMFPIDSSQDQTLILESWHCPLALSGLWRRSLDPWQVVAMAVARAASMAALAAMAVAAMIAASMLAVVAVAVPVAAAAAAAAAAAVAISAAAAATAVAVQPAGAVAAAAMEVEGLGDSAGWFGIWFSILPRMN